MHILIKLIDTYYSKQHKGKTLNEYIVYVMVDDVLVEAYTEIGSEKVVNLVDELRTSKNITEAFFIKQ